jgi:hypothetical protein
MPPPSTATLQGTDFSDHNPEVEPLVEIYQGCRNSYEYEGAPRSATRLNPQAQKSGFEPAGFWWNALAKGYKLGVQSSSDHWSTDISYAFLIAENSTRKGLVDAIRKRHAYGATDNIVLDFCASAGGASYLMGNAIRAGADRHWSDPADRPHQDREIYLCGASRIEPGQLRIYGPEFPSGESLVLR